MTTTCYDVEIRHDGRSYTFTIPHLDIPVCQACEEKVFTEKVDDQINAALRSHLHLLTPDEMRTALERIDMTQKQAADRLGIAEATLSRWVTETQIQSRAMDNLLRIFFAFPQVRAALNEQRANPPIGVNDIDREQNGTASFAMDGLVAQEDLSHGAARPMSGGLPEKHDSQIRADDEMSTAQLFDAPGSPFQRLPMNERWLAQAQRFQLIPKELPTCTQSRFTRSREESGARSL